MFREFVIRAVPQVTTVAQVKPFSQGVLVPPLSSNFSFLRLVIALWQGTRGSSPCGGARFGAAVHTGLLKVNSTTRLMHELEKARLRIAPAKPKAV